MSDRIRHMADGDDDGGAPLLARIPPPIWALLYLILALGIDRVLRLRALLYAPILGAIAILGGVALSVSAVVEFRKAGTAVRPDAPVNSALVTTGIFSRSCNPMYLGLVLITLGAALIQGSLPFFLVPAIVYFTNNAVVIPYEEAKMRRQFGDSFRHYCEKVGRWL